MLAFGYGNSRIWRKEEHTVAEVERSGVARAARLVELVVGGQEVEAGRGRRGERNRHLTAAAAAQDTRAAVLRQVERDELALVYFTHVHCHNRTIARLLQHNQTNK